MSSDETQSFEEVAASQKSAAHTTQKDTNRANAIILMIG